MLFAPTLADNAILPTAWGGRYFFNRIGSSLPLAQGSEHQAGLAPIRAKMASSRTSTRAA
ncbi:MAG: hypothetical protein E6Q69_01165 [Aquipseudomonas alcaligenes]|uniref:Uncharacterized protein n=1 Tax=Aquipseudomonas alcaligenes TaxID=43263 RepID=A0A5C7WGB3_AQUAC|nr:MAG: hypothetical protein E6Q69_01165 [Pseudomonas alcaligenes]